MLYQIIIAAGLVGFMFNLILNLRTLKRPPGDSKIPEPAPSISVLIPARDEEANIEACLESLEKQDYPDYFGLPAPGWVFIPYASQPLCQFAADSWCWRALEESAL